MSNVPVAPSVLVDLVNKILYPHNRGVSAMWSVDDNVMKLSVPCTDTRVAPFIYLLATVEDMGQVDIVHRIVSDRLPNILQLAMSHFTIVKKLLGQSAEEIEQEKFNAELIKQQAIWSQQAQMQTSAGAQYAGMLGGAAQQSSGSLGQYAQCDQNAAPLQAGVGYYDPRYYGLAGAAPQPPSLLNDLRNKIFGEPKV